MTFMDNNTSILQKVSMLILVTYPILEVYSIGGSKISIAGFLGLCLWVFTSAQKGLQGVFRVMPTTYYLFWVYMAFQTYLIAGISGWSDYIPGGIDFVIFSLVLMTLTSNFDHALFYRYLKYVFLFSTALFLFQYATFYLTHHKISVFLPLSNQLLYCDFSYSELVEIQVTLSNSLLQRFSSIFCEPSYYAQYTLLVLCVELFGQENEEKLFTPFSLFIVAILIMTQSGSGMVGLVIIAIMKLVQIIFITSKKVYYFYLLAIIPIAIWAISYYISTSMGASMMDRVSEIDGSKGEETSGFARIFLGWNIYDMLTPVQKVIGTDRAFMQYYWDGGFFNGITSLICSRGLIGLLLLIVAYLSSLRHSNPVCVYVLLIFLVISLFESTFLGGLMMLATTVAFGYKYKTQSNKM